MIYLVRHGRTEFNVAGRFQGGLDSPLTPEGVSQGRRIGALLRTLIDDAAAWRIVASPLGRAGATAKLIATALDVEAVDQDRRLAEISLGEWEGLTDEEIEAAYPGARDGLDRWNWYFHAPQGETYAAFSARLTNWLDDALVAGAPLIVVSHGVAGRVLRGQYAKMDRDSALRLDVPQDAVFRLAGGTVERIDCTEK